MGHNSSRIVAEFPDLLQLPGLPGMPASLFNTVNIDNLTAEFKLLETEWMPSDRGFDWCMSRDLTSIPVRDEQPKSSLQRRQERKVADNPIFRPIALRDVNITENNALINVLLQLKHIRDRGKFAGKYCVLMVDSNIFKRTMKVPIILDQTEAYRCCMIGSRGSQISETGYVFVWDRGTFSNISAF